MLSIKKFLIIFFKKKRYGHIISLGYNCEVSFQFFLKYKFVESSLFAWVNAVNCQTLIAALKDLDSLASKGFEKVGPMYKDIASGIYFHGKNMNTEQEEVEELKSRIVFLKNKFLKTAQDGKKNLYIFKYPPFLQMETRGVREDIMALHKELCGLVKNDFDLLIILEKKRGYFEFEIPNIFVRYVNFFMPEAKVTSRGNDRKGFGKVFSEFVPNFKLTKNKRFKFEKEITGEDS